MVATAVSARRGLGITTNTVSLVSLTVAYYFCQSCVKYFLVCWFDVSFVCDTIDKEVCIALAKVRCVARSKRDSNDSAIRGTAKLCKVCCY